MPFARIDLVKGRSAAERKAIGEAVYQSLLSIGVPEEDRFQVINEHDLDNFIFSTSYLGIERTDALIMIQITLNEGRTVELKRTLFSGIADRLEALGQRRQDILINLVEVKKENWSFGDGIAQYAPAEG
jgi:4-oxalocrotonate tautomerase